jgi:hypothetical protein
MMQILKTITKFIGCALVLLFLGLVKLITVLVKVSKKSNLMQAWVRV